MSDHPKGTPKRWESKLKDEPSSSSKDRPSTQARVQFEEQDSPRPTRPKPYVKLEKEEGKSDWWNAPGKPFTGDGTGKPGGKERSSILFAELATKLFFKGR